VSRGYGEKQKQRRRRVQVPRHPSDGRAGGERESARECG